MAGPIQFPFPPEQQKNFKEEVVDGELTLIPINAAGRDWIIDQQEGQAINPSINPTFFQDNQGIWFASFTPVGETTGRKALPAGFYYSDTEAVEAAESGGLRGESLNSDGSQKTPSEYEILVINGKWTFAKAGEEQEADKRYSVQIDRTTGDLIRVDLDAKPDSDGVLPSTIISKAPTKPLAGWKKIPGPGPAGKPVDLGNGKFLHAYEVTDSTGNTSTKYVTTETSDPQDVGLLTDIELGEGRGDFAYLGNGRYEHVPDIKAPFKFGAGDLVSLPEQGGSLVRISENQYQFVRDTYDPGVKEHTDSQGNVRQFSQSASGTWTELAPRFDPDVIEKGGREFIQQTTGQLTELDPRFDPGIQTIDGMSLLRQTTGQIGQLTQPNLDQIITQALVDGEYDKAFAFQDFRDRPSASETFQTALQFARSPADQVLISSIARGEQTVQPPPAGTIQRVGPQPDFLVQAYQDFQRRTQAGRAPTEEEATGLSARAAAGQTPQTDTLQGRLEKMQQELLQGEEIHQAKLENIRAKGARDEETWRQLFDQKEETFKRERKTKETVETDEIDPETGLVRTGTSRTVVTDEDEDEEYGEQITEENRLAVIADRTQQAIDLGFSAEINPETGLSYAAELAESTPSGTPFTQHAAMSFQESLAGMGQANALDIIAKGSGGVTSQLSNLAGLSSALEADPTAVLTQAGSVSPTGAIGSLKFENRAGGGTVQPGEITVVGEKGPEIAMMPPGTHILPLGKANPADIRAAQATGRAYEAGGTINFGELPFGLRQLQAGRPITPSRGYLSQAAGLNLPSAQALSNITPESRDVFFDLAQQAGIPSRAFGQELQTAIPRGTRLPTSRILPLGRRGVR
jgi:hypothetical protein